MRKFDQLVQPFGSGSLILSSPMLVMDFRVREG
jgi:hypothetical protein